MVVSKVEHLAVYWAELLVVYWAETRAVCSVDLLDVKLADEKVDWSVGALADYWAAKKVAERAALWVAMMAAYWAAQWAVDSVEH